MSWEKYKTIFKKYPVNSAAIYDWESKTILHYLI